MSTLNWSKTFSLVVLTGVLAALPQGMARAEGRSPAFESVAIFGQDPGRPELRIADELIILSNACLEVCLAVSSRGIELQRFVNKQAKSELILPGFPLSIVYDGGDGSKRQVKLLPSGQPQKVEFKKRPAALRLAERWAGQGVAIPVWDEAGQTQGRLIIELREASHYVRIMAELESAVAGEGAPDFSWCTLPANRTKVAGEVYGSPLIVDDFFVFCEHPMASAVRQGDGTLVPITPIFRVPAEERRICRSIAVGVLPSGQHRRGFLVYLERERPRPYQPFVNYNSWWDIAWGDRKMNEEQCLRVIEAFGTELAVRRNVLVDAFVFDDGWDDNRTLWQFHEGFPRGFTPLRELAAQFGSGVGTWFSPFGGYGQARKERLAYGAQEGLEINERGFSLAGPRYFARFRDVCFRMLREYDVRYFKFDGIAEGSVGPGAARQFGPDIEALLYLAQELKREKPELFVSITTGTWPSAAWLLYGDSVWRGGHDWAAHGEGPVRQQWITYRDMEVFRRVVRRAPLYPINSLMTVTVCFGQLGTALQMGREPEDVADEMWMAAASGTQNFELYLTPSLMTQELWDVLAAVLTWLRENQHVLVDVHWVGGDPGNGEVYGYAAWSPVKALLALRNPKLEGQQFTISLTKAWEIPPTLQRAAWRLQTRYNPKSVDLPGLVGEEDSVTVELPGLAVVIVEATPVFQPN